MKELLINQEYGGGGRNRGLGSNRAPRAADSKQGRGLTDPRRVPAQATYYSPRQYADQEAVFSQKVTTARAAMEERSAALRTAQSAVEDAWKRATEQGERYERLKDKFQGETAGQYRQQLMDNWTAAVQEFKAAQGNWEKEYAAYSPYEEAYNKAAAEYNNYIRGEREAYGQWKATIRGAEDIRAELKTVEEKRRELVNRMQYADQYGPDNDARIAELQTYLGARGDREKLLQEELEYSERFRYEDLRQSGDFAEKSVFTGADDRGDRLYQYINGNRDAAGSLRDWWDKTLDQQVPNEGTREALGINGTPEYLEYMDEDEVAMYNYLYSTQGAEKAGEYLDYIRQDLTARQMGTAEELTGKLVGQNWLTKTAGSVLSVPMNAVSGIQGLMGTVGATVRGEGLDPNASYYAMGNVKNTIRDEVAKSWGPVGSYMYQVGMSIPDMMMDAMAGPGAMALIGSRVLSEGVVDAKKRGLSDLDAWAMGVSGAAAELLTERIGLDETLELPDEWASAGFWKGLLHGAWGEAKEEGLTNLTNLAADIFIAGEKSEFMQNVADHKAEGMDDQKAVLTALKDAGISLGLDALGGGISGGVFGGYRGAQGKKANEAKEKAAANMQQNKESAANMAAEKNEDGEYTGFVDDGEEDPAGESFEKPPEVESSAKDTPVAGGAAQENREKAPSVSEADSSPVPDGTGESLTGETVKENGGNGDGEGEHVLSGGTERNDAPGAREQAEQYEALRERQQEDTRSQTERAAQRRVKAENLERLGKARRISSQELGLKQGTEVRELLELPRYEWDDDLWDTVSRIEKETGYKVRTVVGNIGVRLKDGGVGLAKGYIDRVSGTIVLNAAHSQVTAGQIADHELWHWKTDSIQRISGDRYEMIRIAQQRIREEYGDEELDAVLHKYIDGYGDVYDMNAPDFLDRVYEEIMADAYAGINAFGADAAKFRSTVDAVMDESGMGRDVWNAQEQAEYAAPGGDQRVYTDEDAPPPRDEDYSQIPQEEYDGDGWDDRMIDFSYGGENAKNADREALGRAQRMEEQGFDRKDIFRDTGWFRGADGKWRFEIDDFGMKYHPTGDAQFSKDHPEYRRYRELELKFIEGTITDAQIAEMAELRSTWANEAPRLRQMVVRGIARLYHVLAHDALFEQYPQLRDTRVRFGETDDAGGYWDQERNEIVVSNRYRHADPGFLELTLLHEIQHAIQDIEGFANGSNPEYWEERQRGTNPIRENDAKIAKAEREAQEALKGVPPEVQKDFWYAANMRETDPEGAEKLENELFEGEYSDAYSDYSWAIWTLQDLLEQDNPKRTAKDLYRNTAGEIEARDTANRRHLDAGARKKRLPDTGDERTVFVDGAGRALDLIGKRPDGIEVYETSEETRNLTWKERKNKFLRLMRDQYRGRTAKFIKNGDTYYARFEYRDVSKNIYGDSGSDQKGRDAKVNVGADGEIFELVENSRYIGSEAERGKNTKTHRGVENWDYFVKTVQIDDAVFDLTANVRQRPDGEFVYAIEMHENKEIEPSSPEGSQTSGLNGVPNSSTNSLQDAAGNVKRETGQDVRFSLDSEGRELTAEQEEYFKNSKVRLDEDGEYWYGEGRLTPVYHATDEEFTVFLKKHLGRNTDNNATDASYAATAHLGFWFNTSDLSGGKLSFADRSIKAYLNIRNPYHAGTLDGLATEIAGMMPDSISPKRMAKAYLDDLKARGYDGIVIDDEEMGGMSFAAFESNQIKRTDNTAPTEKRDIRFSLDDGESEAELVERMAGAADAALEGAIKADREANAARADAEAGEAAAKAERKRKSEQRQMERNRERAAEHKAERQRLRREANAVMTDDLQQFGKPQWVKRDTTKRIMDLFDTPAGMKNETKALIEEYLDHILEKGSLEDDDRRTLMTRLIERGVVSIEPDEIMSEGRSYLKGNKIFVSDSLRQEFGDDWNRVRKKAFGLGLYLVDDRAQAGVDQWWQDMAGYLPGMFDAEETDQRTMLERLLWIAEEGKAEKLSLAEYTRRLAKQEQVSEADLLDGMAGKLEKELAQFARDAEVEMKLRGYTKKNIGERMHRQLTRERLQRAADKAHYRETMQNARNREELNKLQERTLKTLRWLNRNKYRASEEIQERIREVLSDIDLYAVGAANELNWHPKYEMTWRELAEVYKASKDSPNFIPSEELDRIVARLDNRKIEELDVNALNDLFNAAVGLRKEIFDAKRALSFAADQSFDELYMMMTGEMKMAKKPEKGSFADKFFNIEQLTPMNVLRQMGGWRPGGAFAKMAGVLEQGERDVRAYKVRANRILADWLEANRDWVHKADGQGKDGIWIEVEVPQLKDIGLDGGAVFGDTVKVKMTPMQRVHLFLESRNEDNLRHMVGGRTFADPELYSQGKRTEAYAQGITVKMAPETVKALVKDLTEEELELARLLDSYYNGLAHDEINRVSNKLYGYNKAMGKRYAPIFTNQNFTKSEAGIFNQTAEGVGNLKERVKAKNPSYNISALDAFERNVDKTAEFVGMAIPARDWNSLLNWRTRDSSMKDEITHQWGQERLDYIDKLLVDLQGGTPGESGVMQELGDKLLSNYISSTFGFNPGIVLKQAGSLPLAAAYLGAENMSFDMFRKERRSREFIAKYTQELQWRSMGYDMPETKQLKDEPGWAQRSGKKWVEDIFGGGFITKMDEGTASILWAWAENKVRREHPGLEVGDQTAIDEGRSPFYQKVAEEFDRAVSHSQSVSDVAHQSTMRRSKGVLARTFTMFRSDSAQTYNALRQMWGEKEYWDSQAKRYADAKTENGKAKLAEAQEQQGKAAKRIGTVVVATACNALLAELVDFAMAAIKGKLKNYEDEEEERLTVLSVLGEMFGGMLESGAGIVTGGDEIAGLLGRFITGKKGYGEEAPGLEQLLDLEDRIATAVEGIKKGDILGAVREIGMAFSTYYAGFPAENMEKFLITGLARHLAPGLVAGYEDALEAPTKSDLKGLDGAALETRMGHVMKEYGMDLDDGARAALAKIYGAGYTDAVPSAAPDKVTIDGQERKLGRQAQREYDKIRSQVVNAELAAVIASPFLKEADKKTQAKMLNRLYDYAGEQAKAQILEGYEPSDSVAEYAEIAQAGGSIADCVIFKTETADMKAYMKADLLREWDADANVKELMFRHMVSESQDEEIAELRKAGVSFDQFLEVYAMHGQIDAQEGVKAADKATEFAYWLDGQRYNAAQKAAIKSEMAYFQFMPAEAERYNTATAAGLDAEDALELTEKLNELEPPEGKDSIQQIQKWRVAIDDAWDEESQLQRLKAVNMEESAYAKCEALWSQGVAPAAYVRAQEIKSRFDADGNGSLKNEDWRDLINSMVPSGIALPGDTEHFNMTNEQMGFLWQMLTGSKSTRNNPFSKSGGEKWLDMKEEMKEKEKEE